MKRKFSSHTLLQWKSYRCYTAMTQKYKYVQSWNGTLGCIMNWEECERNQPALPSDYSRISLEEQKKTTYTSVKIHLVGVLKFETRTFQRRYQSRQKLSFNHEATDFNSSLTVVFMHMTLNRKKWGETVQRQCITNSAISGYHSTSIVFDEYSSVTPVER